jgi:K+-transporting ATPase ATPase C chain
MQHFRPAIMLTLCFALFTGVAFPVVVWALGRVAFAEQAQGSLLRDRGGKLIGSKLIGQSFTDAKYFHPRPSAAGTGYDAASSSGTNLGPSSDKLVNRVKDDESTPDADESYAGFGDLARAYREENGLPPDAELPADAVTRSGSGLDPDISPANARLQAARVARARGVALERVRALVAEQTEGRTLGLFGEPRANVLLLNLALDGHD